MVHAPKRMGSAHQPHAAVLRGVRVECDDGVDDLVGVQEPLVVPVPEILVPLPGAAAAGLLQQHLGVRVVRLRAAHERRHSLNQRGRAAELPVRVVAEEPPECKFCVSALGVLHRDLLLVDGVVRADRGVQDVDLLRAKPAAAHDELQAAELRGKRIAQDFALTPSRA